MPACLSRRRLNIFICIHVACRAEGGCRRKNACTRPPLFFTFPWLPPVDGVSERRVPLLFPIAAYLFISLAVRRWAESERRATLIFTHDTHGGCESKEPFALFFISPFCAQSCLQRHFRCALTERVGLFLIEKS